MKSIRYQNNGIEIAANLHFPEGFSEDGKYAAIVCAHPISSCKEQTSGAIYGKALARAGFINLAFDASTQGASGGEPRFLENPATRVEDFRCAVDYLVTLPYVDKGKIGVLGVCGGGGYAVSAAATDHRFKAVSTIVGANYGRLMREGDMTPDAAIKTLEAIGKQRTAEARGAEPLIVGYIPNSEAEREQAGLNDIDIVEVVEYYTTPRGQQPGSPNKLRFVSTGAAMNWDAFAFVETLLIQPLHIVIGSIPGGFGSYRDGFELYRRARSEQKSLQIVRVRATTTYTTSPRPPARRWSN